MKRAAVGTDDMQALRHPAATDTTSAESALSRRIWITRYLMVIGIVALHVPPYQSLSELGHSPFDLLKGFFSHGLFRATVPVLTAISGFLVFRSKLFARPRMLLQKKTTTLLVPLILWNLPLALALYVLQRHQLLHHAVSETLYPFDLTSWLNAVLGLFESPVNYPLNFLRDLFVIALLSPLFGWFLIRMPMIGLAAVAAIYWTNIDGQLVLRQSMIVSFYIGGLAAVRNWNLMALDRFAWPFLALIFAYCVAVPWFDIENREAFRLVSPLLVWPVMSLIVDTRAGGWLYRNSQCSFFTFLSHGPMLFVLSQISKGIPGIPYPLFWAAAPVFVVATGAIVTPFFKRQLPRLASIALGGR